MVWLFGTDPFYPRGGMADLIGVYATPDAALEAAMENRFAAYQLLEVVENHPVMPPKFLDRDDFACPVCDRHPIAAGRDTCVDCAH